MAKGSPPPIKLLKITPARFTGRLAAMGEMWRWRWNSCGANGGATIFSWIGDVQMRNAVGFQLDQYPRIKIASASWDAMELMSCEYWSWRCHILNMRGARCGRRLEFVFFQPV